MRVISGSARGRKLVSRPGESTRPTADKVKESVFNIIQAHVSGSRVLDLFAGSGALGIEALSRGADHATFVEKDFGAMNIVKTNLENTRLSDKSSLIKGDALSFLKNTDERFDIIFIDPPYASGLYEEVFSLISSRRLLSPEGIIISEHKTGAEVTLCNGLRLLSERKYGNVSVSIIKGDNL